jgi:uncharacterized delta-60 repeat protein
MTKKIFTILICFLALSISIQAAPGDLDSSFGNGGKVVSPIGRISADRGFAAALQSDGKIVVAGDSQSNNFDFAFEPNNLIITRINADGSLDTSFGAGGKASKRLRGGSRANSVVIQPDGKIVVGGFVILEFGTNDFRSVFLLARLNPNGSFDNSFGTNGVVTTQFENGLQGVVNSLALQPDGKIVAAGYSYFSTALPQSIAVNRYNTDGSLDNNFDGDGKLLVNINAVGNRANAVVIQPDGKIVVGGSLRESTTSITDFVLVRLNTDGSFDNGFDGDGKLTTKFGTTSSTIAALSLQPDGKIVAAGNSNAGTARDIALARYNTDGSPDTSFDTDGVLTTNIADDFAFDVELQADGKIVVAGQTLIGVTPSIDFLSIRYNTDGSLDNSYDGDGKVTTHIDLGQDRASAVLIQPDGKIVLAGHNSNIPDTDLALTRYNPNGSLDASFSGDGIAVIELANSADIIIDTALQADGKIVAVGYSFGGLNQDVTLARYNADGTLDTGFGNQGSVIMPFADFSTYANEVVIQPDGKIIVTASNYGVTEGKFILIRFNPDGSLDNSFGTAGIAMVQVGLTSDLLHSVALQPDGKIVAGGGSNTSNASGASLLRLNSNGTPDASFGSGGKVITIVENRSSVINSIALQADGKIIAVGYSSINFDNAYSFFVSRYNTDGTLDTSFGGTGTVYTSFNSHDVAFAVQVQSNGKIVAVGFSDASSAIARYNTDGSLDASFDGDGKIITTNQGNAYFQLRDLVIQPNGKLILVGGASDGTDSDSVVLRLNPDGSFDNSFGSGGKVITSIGDGNNEYYNVLLRPDGKIIAGGYSSNGANDDFTLVRYIGGETLANQRALFDFDGDGKSDVSVFRPSDGVWYLNRSSQGFTAVQFGISTDKLAAADYDGDGKTDLAVFRDNTWYLLRSQAGFAAYQFGATGDVPQPADFDDDGKAELAVFRPSDGTWYILNLVTNQFNGVQFGANGDKPVVADYDGDGKADYAVFRPSDGTWYLLRSQLGFAGVQFGISTDKPVVGDYDGDGKADPSVYRDGVWYQLRSSQGFVAVQFGIAADLPAPADYDGDGKTDLAVYRDNTWYLLQSTNGFAGLQFGAIGDKPVPNSPVQ